MCYLSHAQSHTKSKEAWPPWTTTYCKYILPRTGRSCHALWQLQRLLLVCFDVFGMWLGYSHSGWRCCRLINRVLSSVIFVCPAVVFVFKTWIHAYNKAEMIFESVHSFSMHTQVWEVWCLLECYLVQRRLFLRPDILTYFHGFLVCIRFYLLLVLLNCLLFLCKWKINGQPRRLVWLIAWQQNWVFYF